MPDLSHVRKSGLRQPGFYWKGNAALAAATDTTRGRIYAALVGKIDFNPDGSVNTKTIKAATAQRMETFIQAVLEHADAVIRSRRDLLTSDAAAAPIWKTVADQFPGTLHGSDLSGEEAKITLEAMVEARLEYDGKTNPSTPLTALVDRFIELEEVVAALEAKKTAMMGDSI